MKIVGFWVRTLAFLEYHQYKVFGRVVTTLQFHFSLFRSLSLTAVLHTLSWLVGIIFWPVIFCGHNFGKSNTLCVTRHKVVGVYETLLDGSKYE